MAYTVKGVKNDKLDGHVGNSALSKFQKIETALAADCATYSVADTFVNDKQDGFLGPAVCQALNEMCAAMANSGAHYASRVFPNDKTYGHLGPDLLAKLNGMSAYVATLRP